MLFVLLANLKKRVRLGRAARSALFLGFASILVIPSAAFAAPLKNTLEISGWLPYWRIASSTKDVLPHISSLTTVHPFGYTLSEDGIVYDTAALTEEPWTSFISTAHANKVRVIPTVMSGDGEMLHRILSNYESRIKLEDDITALVMQNNFDGIDIDFEAKLVETKPYFSLFLKGLYQRMVKKWVYCTIESRTPVSSRYPNGNEPPDARDYANDYVAINKYCDRVQIMAYDQGQVDRKLTNEATGPYAPVADPRWAEKVITLAAQTIPKKKLVLGIPTYGYEWSVEPSIGNSFDYRRLWAFNPRYALDFAAAQGLVPTRNVAGELSFSYIPQIASTTLTAGSVPVSATIAGPAVASRQPFNVMWWSDSVSVAQKVALAKKLGIRGVAVFKFDGGEDQQIWDVLK